MLVIIFLKGPIFDEINIVKIGITTASLKYVLLSRYPDWLTVDLLHLFWKMLAQYIEITKNTSFQILTSLPFKLNFQYHAMNT